MFWKKKKLNLELIIRELDSFLFIQEEKENTHKNPI